MGGNEHPSRLFGESLNAAPFWMRPRILVSFEVRRPDKTNFDRKSGIIKLCFTVDEPQKMFHRCQHTLADMVPIAWGRPGKLQLRAIYRLNR